MNDGPNIEQVRDSAENDQLDWIKTPFTNSILRGNGDDVGDLPCELALDPRYGTGGSVVTVSAWELDERQRDLIAAGAHMRMSVWQHPIPPLALAIEAPFCDSCGAPKTYVRAAKEFVCSQIDCPARDSRIPGSHNNGRVIGPGDADGGDAQRGALDEAHQDFTAGGEIAADEAPPTP